MDRPFAPYEGTEPYIFVSYSHADSERVLPVLTELDRAGYRIWYDKGIPWSAEWQAIIQERLDHCAVCLAFLSPSSVESKHCRREIHYADKVSKPIFSAYLEKTELKYGLGIQLSLYQSVNCYEYPSIDVFVAQLKQEMFLATCLSSAHTYADGEIKWSLNNEGLLTIAKIPGTNGEMQDYEYDSQKGSGTAPWMEWKEKIISLRIESGVTTIGVDAFWNCENLTYVEIPDSIIIIKRGAFDHCNKLQEIKIPNGIKNIASYLFCACSSLTSVKIPSSVISIGESAFRGCSSLTRVTIPDSVQEIGSNAFVGTGLTEAELPAHTKVAKDAFFPISRRK